MFSVVFGRLTAGTMGFHILYATTKTKQTSLNIIQQSITENNFFFINTTTMLRQGEMHILISGNFQ